MFVWTWTVGRGFLTIELRATKENQNKGIYRKRMKSEVNLKTAKLPESNPVVTKQIMRRAAQRLSLRTG